MRIIFEVFLMVVISHHIFAQRNYHLSKEEMTYKEAINYCAGLNTRMVIIENDNMSAKVHEFSKRNKVECFWIDGNDNGEENLWVDSNKKRLTYKNWNSSQPSGGSNKNCIRVANATWFDEYCNSLLRVICQPLEVLDIRNHFKFFPTKMTYKDAISHCKGEGMGLVKVNDAIENRAVYNMAVHYDLGEYWIDGNDIAEECSWVDSYNETLPFTNWHHDEPNGSRENNCIQGFNYPNGLWEDANCISLKTVICSPSLFKKAYGMNDTKDLNVVKDIGNVKDVKDDKGVKEVKDVKYMRDVKDINNGMSEYITSNITMNFTEAVKNCQSQNLEIVNISNDFIEKEVAKFAKKQNLKYYWIYGHYMDNTATDGDLVAGKKIVHGQEYCRAWNFDARLQMFYPCSVTISVICSPMKTVDPIKEPPKRYF